MSHAITFSFVKIPGYPKMAIARKISPHASVDSALLRGHDFVTNPGICVHAHHWGHTPLTIQKTDMEMGEGFYQYKAPKSKDYTNSSL